MKKAILAFVVVFCALACFAQQNVITFTVADFGQAAVANTRVTLTLLSPNPRTSGVTFIRQDPVAKLTSSLGVCTFNNILWGIYRVDIAGAVGTTFKIEVLVGTVGAVHASSLVVGSPATPPNPINTYYNQSQIDIKFAASLNGINITNILGTNVLYSTNSAPSVSLGATIMDMSKQYSAAVTNANWLMADPIGVSLYKTNVQWAVRFFTNSAWASAGTPNLKTITFPAGWIGNRLSQQITQQSVLSVVVYPGFGTNFVIRHLK